MAALAVQIFIFCFSWRLGVLAVQFLFLDLLGVLGGLGGSFFCFCF
jgi:hypothetical protein